MLPGFRFLFAAIVLSMSILVFGFGAAALLRTAHEEFANTPSWQPAPETRFAQSRDASPPATQPVLAMLLRVDDAPKDTSKDALKTDPPAPDNAPATAPSDQAAAIAAEPPSAPEKIAVLQPADVSPPEAAKPEAPPVEAPVAEPAPQAETAADAPAAPDATKIAATEQSLPPTSEAAAAPAPSVEMAPAAPEQATVPVDIDNISTRIATLGGPPVTIDQRSAKTASAKPHNSAAKKHQRARREMIRRRRIAAARALLAKQTPPLLDAFGQPVAVTATR